MKPGRTYRPTTPIGTTHMNATQNVAGTRYVFDADGISKLSPLIGSTVDTTTPAWAGLGVAVAGLAAGTYSVASHISGPNSKHPGTAMVKLIPADDTTSAALKLSAARKRLAAIGTPEWIASERAKAEAAVAKAEAAVAALTPTPVAVATPTPVATPVATPAPTPDVAAIVAAVMAAMAGGQ